MCGSPAVPNISAMPSDTASSGFATSLPGASTLSPYCAAAAANSRAGLKPNFDSTMSARSAAPPRSRNAFTICTHVVAIMPPNSTYASIAAPTMMIAVS